MSFVDLWQEAEEADDGVDQSCRMLAEFQLKLALTFGPQVYQILLEQWAVGELEGLDLCGLERELDEAREDKC